MTLGSILYTIFFGPLQLLFEVIYMLTNKVVGNPGLSIVVLSFTMNILVLPLYRRADAMQEKERNMENALRGGVAHIKKTFKGDERMMILQTYYRQNNYKPTDVFKGSVSLFLEIPFFVAAYRFLSHLELLKGVSFGPFYDLGSADGLIQLYGMQINILPFIMTGVNLISCLIFTKGYPLKSKIQLYGMAIFFFFFLYGSPSGLLIYWTLNNLFSLVKTIMYKVKNPRKILASLAFACGLCIFMGDVLIFWTDYLKLRLFVGLIGVCLMVPWVWMHVPVVFLQNKISKHFVSKGKGKQFVSDDRAFFCSILFLIVLLGGAIPSAVIMSSPQEFANIFYFVHPLWFVVSAVCFAVGTFGVWMGVYRWLVDDQVKRWFDFGMVALCFGATINYMFFGKDLGLISSQLAYENGIDYSFSQEMINLFIVVVVIACVFLAYIFCKKVLCQLIVLSSVALLLMTASNANSIMASIQEIEGDVQEAGENEPSIPLSKTGKNVVVLMLDRAMGELVPYLMDEKPELEEQFAGFTYYENTVSYGAHTNIASPALFGGYEYTPFEMNKRDSEQLVDKHNEALKVMPVMFDREGFEVTVCDPTYANYQLSSGLSIYDDYPEMHTYLTSGRFNSKEIAKKEIDNNNRNFFCYSMMKCMPLFVQHTMYDKGRYYNSVNQDTTMGDQVAENQFVANGLSVYFLNEYTVLENLANMTEIKDSEKGTFLMMSNDTTHEAVILQKPGYEHIQNTNNTAYEKANKDLYTVNGKKYEMTTPDQYAHYDVNMAALLSVGRWLDYLRENDVYDNTRIIIVSDHGSHVSTAYEYSFYMPLLMVKDFNETEFKVSEELMTNGDVPTLAVTDVLTDLRNPFTEKEISSDYKSEEGVFVSTSHEWSPKTNNGNVFLPGPWYSVSGDSKNADNWVKVQENSISPLEEIR